MMTEMRLKRFTDDVANNIPLRESLYFLMRNGLIAVRVDWLTQSLVDAFPKKARDFECFFSIGMIEWLERRGDWVYVPQEICHAFEELDIIQSSCGATRLRRVWGQTLYCWKCGSLM